ncbi:499_t:CDS:2 [Gigaspora margarita]|uniref:499_t:CDS:1 n=1 Tax=Gigaspora margarita TaxID=4874 RepID=A0ABN7VYS9_GIGMA|nr:499_t:CDS:2 [Gigaspora margarita]
MNPKEVLEETKIHFENQMRARNYKILAEEACIQNTWFQDILSEITEEKWYIVIGSLKVKMAPGILVQEAKELHYYISILEPKLRPENYIQKKEIKVAVVAYADVTTWLVPNKQVIEKMLSIANEFFHINDIQINVKKSNLIVFNPKTKMEEINITFGSNSI